MGDDRPALKETPAAGAEAGGAKPPEASKAAFSRKGIFILGAIVVLEGAAFLAFIATNGRGKAQASEEAHRPEPAASREQDFEDFLKVGRAILDVGEIKVPIQSTQPRAPRSITATIQVVITKELAEKLTGGGGGHGGGGKSNPQRDVLVLNIRSILRGMMDGDGIRLIEPSAKLDFEKRARERLNTVQLEGDEERAQVLKVLRGHVLQVIIDKFDSQTY
jgi:hypothetical protein